MQTTVARLANTSETKLKGKLLKTDLKSSPKLSIHDSNLKLHVSKCAAEEEAHLTQAITNLCPKSIALNRQINITKYQWAEINTAQIFVFLVMFFT